MQGESKFKASLGSSTRSYFKIKKKMEKKSARTADQQSGAGLASVRPWVRFLKQPPPEKTTNNNNSKKKKNTKNKEEHSLPSKTSVVILPLDMKTVLIKPFIVVNKYFIDNLNFNISEMLCLYRLRMIL